MVRPQAWLKRTCAMGRPRSVGQRARLRKRDGDKFPNQLLGASCGDHFRSHRNGFTAVHEHVLRLKILNAVVALPALYGLLALEPVERSREGENAHEA